MAKTRACGLSMKLARGPVWAGILASQSGPICLRPVRRMAWSWLGSVSRGAAGCPGLSWWGAVLVVSDEVLHGHNVIAVRARCARPDASAPGVTVLAALGAEVAGLALWAFVDGVDLGWLGGSGCCPASSPGGLAARVGAPSAASGGGETGSALRADGRRCRLGIVTHAGHRGVAGSDSCGGVGRGGGCRCGLGGPGAGRSPR